MGNFFRQSDDLTTEGARRARSLIPSHLAGQAGISLVEILVAGVVMGFAVIGVALMYGTGSTWMAAIGEDRVAAGLAQQRIEQIRSGGFGAATAILGSNTEPSVGAGGKSFTRVTCIQYVNSTTSDGLTTPAYIDACPAEAIATDTVRITVVVTANNLPQASPVTLQAWLSLSGS